MKRKVNFKSLEIVVSFEGETIKADLTKEIGNLMMFEGSYVGDIGFEDLARAIYYSDSDVEWDNDGYTAAMVSLVSKSPWKAAVKRAIINELTK